MLANYHTHTYRCNHASGTEREYIEMAIQKGFKVLGFSDHVPQPFEEEFRSDIRMRISELADYTDTLLKLRDEYKNDIEILIGYEVEYSRKYFDQLMKIIREYPLDYMIMGQHFVPNEVEGFYSGRETTDEAKLEAYVDTAIEGLSTGLFTYLAHPDLINFEGDDDIFEKHLRRLIEATIKLSIPLEVNMLGFEEGRNYPSDRLFKLATEMGAKTIIGCDAHATHEIRQPEDLPGFTEFLARHNVVVGDNIIEIVRP